MLGDGIVSFGVALRDRAEEREVVGENARVELELARHPHGRRRELDVSLFVVELDLQVVLRLGDPADLVDEVHVPGRPAVFAVGHPLQADVLLHLDDGTDGVRPRSGASPRRKSGPARKSSRALQHVRACAAGCRRGRLEMAERFCATSGMASTNDASLTGQSASRACRNVCSDWQPASRFNHNWA